MHDFSCTDPAEMHYAVLADRVRYFKESKEGSAIMCKVIEDMRREEREEGRQETLIQIAQRMLAAGRYALEEIAEISGLSLDEVRQLQGSQGA